MGDIVNLRRARKRRARAQADSEAAARRVTFGLAPASRLAELARLELATRQLDGHRLGPSVSAHAGDDD